MRISKEAEIGTTKFSLTPDYFAITGKDEVGGADFKVVFSPKDAVDLVVWLNSELFASKPLAVLPGKPQPSYAEVTPQVKEPIYDPGDRSFLADKQTPPLIKSVSAGTGSVPLGPDFVTV